MSRVQSCVISVVFVRTAFNPGANSDAPIATHMCSRSVANTINASAPKEAMSSVFCPHCGEPIDTDSAFCANCGGKIEEAPQSEPQPAASPPIGNIHTAPGTMTGTPIGHRQPVHHADARMRRPPATGWLKFVTAVNWVFVVLFGLGGAAFMTGGSELDAELEDTGVDAVSLAITFLILFAILAIVNFGLRQRNNGARITMSVLNVIFMLLFLTPNVVAMFICVLEVMQFYALVFHKPTIALFKPEDMRHHYVALN